MYLRSRHIHPLLRLGEQSVRRLELVLAAVALDQHWSAYVAMVRSPGSAMALQEKVGETDKVRRLLDIG